MLEQQHRNRLIETIANSFSQLQTFQFIVNATRRGRWNKIVPNNATPAHAIDLIVDAAEGEGWLRDLVQTLSKELPNRFSDLLVEIDRAAPVRATANPLEQVQHLRANFLFPLVDTLVARTKDREFLTSWVSGHGEFGTIPVLVLYGIAGSGKSSLA